MAHGDLAAALTNSQPLVIYLGVKYGFAAVDEVACPPLSLKPQEIVGEQALEDLHGDVSGQDRHAVWVGPRTVHEVIGEGVGRKLLEIGAREHEVIVVEHDRGGTSEGPDLLRDRLGKSLIDRLVGTPSIPRLRVEARLCLKVPEPVK